MKNLTFKNLPIPSPEIAIMHAINQVHLIYYRVVKIILTEEMYNALCKQYDVKGIKEYYGYPVEKGKRFEIVSKPQSFSTL